MQTDRDSLDLHFGRWLLWGLLAVVALIVVIIFFTNLARDSSSPPPAAAEQVEWSIQTSEYTPTPGQVTLKGDVPLGFPTETWKDGFMLARATGNTFAWNMDVSPEVPEPVYDIDQARGSCDDLNDQLDEWASEVGTAAGETARVDASAFAQHALDTMLAEGCQPSQTP